MKISSYLPGIFAALSVMLLLLTGCQVPSTIGSSDKIIVIADTLFWKQVGADIQGVLEKEFITPQHEKVFDIVVHPPEQLGDLTRYQNVLIVGTLDENDQARPLIDKMLPESLKEKVQGDSSYLFQKPNAWARNQLLILIVARDINSFKAHAVQNAEIVFRLYDEHLDAIQSRTMYRIGEQSEITKELMKEHGWSVRVQHDYQVAVDSSEARFVWLRRMNPQREFFVYWQQVKDPSMLSKEWMLSTRDSLTAIYYQGDQVHQDSTIQVQEQDIDFQDRFCIELNGVWENQNLNIGGAFRSFGFYNESDRRLYLIDCSVFAPGERKWPFLRQLSTIARTFKTAEQ
jgi:hypothetical protein